MRAGLYGLNQCWQSMYLRGRAVSHEFSIKPKRNYFEVYYGNKRISTADSLHEAERDIETYEDQIKEYIQTGILTDSRIACFFMR